MTTVIPLVQGDTKPSLVFTLTDSNNNNEPINLTDTTVVLKFKEQDAVELTDTITGVITDPLSGKVTFNFNPETLENSGDYVGEVEITYTSGGVHTAYDLVYFTVREQF